MTKTLRRPMFRGGPINSEGTGITSGLTEYRQGYEGPNESNNYNFVQKQNYPTYGEENITDYLYNIGSIGSDYEKQIGNIKKNITSLDERAGMLSQDPESGGFLENVVKDTKQQKTNLLNLLSPKGKEDYEKNKMAQFNEIRKSQGLPPIVKKIPNEENPYENLNTVNRDQNEISMDDVEARTEKYAKLLGYDKAKTQSIYDAMLAASPAFFKGRSFGETASGVLEAVNKSGAFDKPTNIKQAAAQLAVQREILMDKAKAEAQAKMAELGYKKPTTVGERYTAYIKGGTDTDTAKEFAIRETHGDAYKPYPYDPSTAKSGDIYKVPKDPKNPKGGSMYIQILNPKDQRPGFGYKQII